MHLPSIMQEKPSDSSEEKQTAYRCQKKPIWIDTEEVDRIIAQSVGANKKQKTLPQKESTGIL